MISEPSVSSFRNKTVLVTGGTGTFGRAFVTTLLGDPAVKKIIVFSRDEFKQGEMQRELQDTHDRLRFFLGDVRDLARLERAFQDVDIVVHAAALKQVPALEYNPMEAVKTNIIGTQNVIDAALDNNVEKVLLVSSDKAVHPVNLYGATKLCAEKLTVAANAYRSSGQRTTLSVLRYGNVLGSRGSLVEIVRRQQPTGTITLTDERMTRFWITVGRVMDCVMESVRLMQGGEIFVPKMKSLHVADAIRALAPECRITTIGIRPGEKLHEVLVTEYESRRTYDAGSVFVIRPEFDWSDEKWLAGMPRLAQGFVYSSDHPDFLLSAQEASAIIQV